MSWRFFGKPYNGGEDVGAVRLLRLEAVLREHRLIDADSVRLDNLAQTTLAAEDTNAAGALGSGFPLRAGET